MKYASAKKGPNPKTIILGPGAIGTLFGALLARAGNAVTMLDHNLQRSNLRNENGINVVRNGISSNIKVKSVVKTSTIGTADIVFICTKAYDTLNATKSLPAITGSNTILISLQNGVGNAEIIAQHAPQHTLCASTSMAALYKDDNTIQWTGSGATQLAQFTQGDDTHKISKLLTTAGLQCKILSNAQSMLWGKLIINAAINPVTALHNISNGELLTNEAAISQALKASIEAEKVASAIGIVLPYSDTTKAVIETCKKTAYNESSMLQDIKYNRQTEIESITGAIIKAALHLKIPVPTNQMLYNNLTSKQ